MQIVIVVAVAILLLGLAGIALEKLAEKTDETLDFFAQWLGKGNGYIKFTEPPELERLESHFDYHSYREFNDLEDYEPECYYAPAIREIEYQNVWPVLKRRNLPALQLSIGHLSYWLKTDYSSVSQLRNALSKVHGRYPDAPPKLKDSCKPPPHIEELSPPPVIQPFRYPLYSGWRRVFNGLVRKKYKDDFERYQLALRRGASVAERVSQRNEQLVNLRQKASAKYDAYIASRDEQFKQALASYEEVSKKYAKEAASERRELSAQLENLMATGASALLERIQTSIKACEIPECLYDEFSTKYDPKEKILIHEHRFPNLKEISWVRSANESSTASGKFSQREANAALVALYPCLALSLLKAIFQQDLHEEVEAFAVNGWVEYYDAATGQLKSAYCISVMATRSQIAEMDFARLEPMAAFASLKGVYAKTAEVTPIAPLMKIDTEDRRFVAPKTVVSELTANENLASIGWEDFEHLCREVLEKWLGESGAEVKVTQASRDHGVDAVIFDPDPIRGGKIIVQAKRYTKVVDVSAVRDLFGVVQHEGAMKGILMTTSHFGADSYSFAQGKPITLISGPELLGLLHKYGYRFRIDLQEAREMLRQ